MTANDAVLRQHARSAVDELGTIADFIRWGASRFSERRLCYGHGTDNPVDEAMTLVLHALGLEPGIPSELFAAALTREEREGVVALLLRRVVERIPAPYLTHRAWFAGLEFYVDERVLIPRSPVAEWIERGFEPWIQGENVRRVLDLGTGSGCIAIACAVALESAAVDAVDCSPEALAVAAMNVATHGVGDRVRVLRSDLYAALEGPYDLIVSNPPYVDAAALRELPLEYAHEPAAALAGGLDGLDCVHEILDGARELLGTGGILVLEVGASRAALERCYPHAPFVWLEFERGGENVLLLNAEQLRGGGVER